MHWGTGITLVYVLFATGTVGFVVFAMQQQVDLVSADYYPQSLAHDARMAATSRADALGPEFDVAVEPRSSDLVVTWPAGMRVESGEITLYRASDARADRHVAVALDERGRQVVRAGSLERGVWTARVSWTANGKAFFTERRVRLP
jgi:nitrogen fixation protein FixH